MQKISYQCHRFHPDIIRHAIWLYFRFTMSYRDVEDLLAERGIDVSYETVRLWVLKFGKAYARRIRKRRPSSFDQWLSLLKTCPTLSAGPVPRSRHKFPCFAIYIRCSITEGIVLQV